MAFMFFSVILMQLLFSLQNTKAQAQFSLNKGSSLEVERHDQPFLVSEDQNFSCGFYPVGKNAFTFSIWFTTNSINKAVVWTANRNSPVNGYGSKVSFHHEGDLVIRDVNGSVVWSTSTNLDASTISLLNTGNLVINNTNGTTVWQSFDSPTDTLLPYQSLTKGKSVISAKAKGEVSSGYYSLYFDSDNVLKLIYDGPVISSIYWPNPGNTAFQNGRTTYNSSRFAVLDETGQFTSSDGFSVSASDLGGSGIRRLTLDSDGNLRMYSMSNSRGSWEVSWEALSELCNVHGLCGQNGICQYSRLLGITCSCLPSYEMNNLNNWNEGCKPKFTYSCNATKSHFVGFPQVDFYGFDISYSQKISYHDCVKKCLQNCSCMGFGYRITGEGVCYPKSTLFNGINSTSFPGRFYLRLPVDSNYSIINSHGSLDCTNVTPDIVVGSPSMFGTSQINNTKWTYIFIFIAIFGALETILLVIGWWYLLRDREVSKSIKEGYKMLLSQFRRFTYRELKEATSNFKEEIGRGSSGVVYRGVLDDKRVVAVKKLNEVTQEEDEFWAEANVIGRINHMNLVRMFGLCSERQHRLIVYEHIENRSLDKFFFGNDMTLQWRQRFKIALGAAKGLAYLHHECLEWVIHCDIKPENILLARDFEPKIADFGLSKLSKRDGSGFNTSHMRGTTGYMAPEWTLHLPITSKVDVYSYGVVLLEIVMGRRVSDWVLDEGEGRMRSITGEVRRVLEGGDESAIASLVDVRLQGQFDNEQLVIMLSVAASCLEEERNKRPTMDEVVKDLIAFDERDDNSLNSS